MTWLDDVTFDKTPNTDGGLIPAIAQDAHDGKILMVAWMNPEALKLTAEKKQAVYWSRSRQKLWHKGETSGHFQQVQQIYMDCDADVICLKVIQVDDIACHTGRRSCFYKELIDNEWVSVEAVLKNPEDIYKHPKANTDDSTNHSNNQTKLENQQDTLSALAKILSERKQADPDTSYVASLYHKGLNKILEKVGEEAIEVVIAAKDINKDMPADKLEKSIHDLVYEVADLWFHTLVLLTHFDIQPSQITNELARRFGVSGIEEKASRH